MTEQVRAPDGASWFQTEQAWERISKQHPDPAKAMDALMELVRCDMDHRHSQERSARRRQWANWWLRLVRVLLGFGALVLIARVAVEFLNQQAPVQGMVILLVGSVPITALFITGKTEAAPRPPREALQAPAPPPV
ncbi:hypothetical protein V1634_08730 [Plantactinospora veratri]|uniref:DUF3040 domain-containing protein n=1 Tax=Plantactinospora veratri TaxID=1436122 RepID=A0ABU7SAD8_9ACTN